MKKTYLSIAVLSCLLVLPLTVALNSCSEPAAPEEKPVGLSQAQMVERGKYLVNLGGCNDCHSPKVMTDHGPVVDTTRILSGSPADMVLPAIDSTEISPGKWYLASSDLTAWVGPWGVSYSANLTPDPATGSGNWTEELFMKMLRTGKFMGVDAGRPIMPPMPWEFIGKLTDEDLKSIFAYLRTVPAIVNTVHAYVPPNEIKDLGK